MKVQFDTTKEAFCFGICWGKERPVYEKDYRNFTAIVLGCILIKFFF